MSKKQELVSYSIGDDVMWWSQAGGSRTAKYGKVLHVVPANIRPYVSNRADSHKLVCLPIPLTPRSRESYLVEVPGPLLGKPRLYWPRVSALLLVKKNGG